MNFYTKDGTNIDLKEKASEVILDGWVDILTVVNDERIKKANFLIIEFAKISNWYYSFVVSRQDNASSYVTISSESFSYRFNKADGTFSIYRVTGGESSGYALTKVIAVY